MQSAAVLVESMFFLEFQQLNSIRNSRGRFLDLIFADDFNDISVIESQMPLLPLDSYHHPGLETILSFSFTGPLIINHELLIYQYPQADFTKLNLYLEQTDWSFLYSTVDLDVMVNMFYKHLFKAIDLYVPKRKIKNQKYPKWYDGPLRKLISGKNRAYNKFKRTGYASDIRREVKYRIDLCYLTFVSNIEHVIPENVKYFWTFINSLKRTEHMPSIMKYNNDTLKTPSSIADTFTLHFESCYSNHSTLDLNHLESVKFGSHLSFHIFKEDEIKKKMLDLDPSKGSGPDGIPPILLKKCPALSAPLCTIFQRSFDRGYVPSRWKYSNLVPIFKSGDKPDIKNYRGISMLSAIPQLLESILTDELFYTFKNYIIDEQHGFYRGRSTTTNLAIYQEFITSSVEAGYQVDTINTDLSKAFDSVCQQLLLKKLSEIGITGNYLKWIKSYLINRRQRVTVNGSVSREVTVSSGVPQGSHIGPILFLLFINDVVSCFKNSHCLLYADDLKFFNIVEPNYNALQSDLDQFVSWCSSNYLELNISKCKVISFYRRSNPVENSYIINNTTLESVSTFNDLGVIFDRELSFSLHVDTIILRAFRLLGFIKRSTKHIQDTKAITCLYSGLIRSILEYCSTVWSPSQAIYVNRIERVQNKFCKYLLFKFHFPYRDLSYETRLLLCGMQTLERRRRDAMLLLLYKIINGDIICEKLLCQVNFVVPLRHTPQSQLFFEKTHRTNYGQRAFMNRLLCNYNKHYSHCDIFNCTLLSVKRMLKF